MPAYDVYVAKTLMGCVKDYLAPLTEFSDRPTDDDIEELISNREKLDCLCGVISGKLDTAFTSMQIPRPI